MRRIKSEILGAILTVAGAELAAAHTVSSRHNWHQHRPAVDPYKGQQTVTMENMKILRGNSTGQPPQIF